MANIRLYQFPTKASPVPADIIYVGDSAAAFDEVQCTIAQIISAYPNLSSLAGLTLANGAIPYSGASAFALLAPGTLGQLLRSGGAGAPTWSTATFPSVATSTGSVMYANGTNWVASTSLWPNTVGSAGKILRSDGTTNAYSTATYPDTAGTANNVLASDGTNFVSATLSSIIDAALGNTQGDILYRDASAWAVLAPGTAGFVLKTGGAAANPSWTNIEGVSVVPTVQKFLSGSGTYTTPAGVFYIKVTCVGGGGGGSGSTTVAANDGGAGGNGGDTTFSTLTASGGSGASNSAGVVGGAGGGGTNGDVNLDGQHGSDLTQNDAAGNVGSVGQGGGSAFFGGGGNGASNISGAGYAGIPNTGGGGGGGLNNFASAKSGSGGGGGGSLWKIISSPAATYSYAVGAGGTAGTAGTSGYAGGAGGAGIIIVEEFYQ